MTVNDLDEKTTEALKDFLASTYVVSDDLTRATIVQRLIMLEAFDTAEEAVNWLMKKMPLNKDRG